MADAAAPRATINRPRRALVTLAWFSAMITTLLGIAMMAPLFSAGRIAPALAFSFLIVLGAAGAAAAFGLGHARAWARPLAFATFGAIGLTHLVWFSITTSLIEAIRCAVNAAILTLLVQLGPPPEPRPDMGS